MPDPIYASDGLPILYATAEPRYKPGTRRLLGLQAQVLCPFCGQEHLHITKSDDLPKAGAYLGEFRAGCDAGKGYHLLVRKM